jgi:hypothetical protein
MPTRRSPIPPLPTVACVIAAALACAGARATDLAVARPPAHLADAAVTVGGRTLHLPAGDWTLIERNWRQAGSRRRGLDVDIYGGWIVDVQAGELRSLVHVELPVHDEPELGRHADSGCRQAPNALRAAATRDGGERDCLATIAEPDLAAALQARAPDAAAWLARHRVRGLEAAVRLVVAHRTDSGFGNLEVILPAIQFASDDDAALWAERLRAAVAPLWAGVGGEAALPGLEPPAGAQAPAEVATAPASAAAIERWSRCLREAAAQLDDAVTPAGDLGTALYPRCRELEAQVATASLEPARAARLSAAELAQLADAAHRRHVEDGVATAVVLELRAERRRAASAPR